MTSDGITFEVMYSEAVLRDAVRTVVWQRAFHDQVGLWLVEAALLALLAYSLTQGDHSWMTGFLGAVALLPALVILAVWVSYRRDTLGKVRQMSTPTARIFVGEGGFKAASDLGAVELPWKAFTELWERPDYWLLFTAPSQFMTLPAGQIPFEAREVIRNELATKIG